MRKRNVAFFLIMMWCLILCGFGCSTDATSEDTDDTTDTETTAEIANLSIGVSNTYVLSDNSDSITVFASVTDDENAAISDASVAFSATGGLLSAATVTTDESGIAEVTFSSGYVDKSNQEVLITAQANGFSTQIPVAITGTTIDITTGGNTTLTVGDDSDTLTIYVEDAGGNPIYNADVALSVSAASSGSVNFSTTSGQTDIYGNIDVTVTGATVGTAIVSVSAAGALASQTYTVAAVDTAVSITSPTSDPASLETGDTLDITVNDPNSGEVVIVTTVGTLIAVSNVTSGSTTGSSLKLNGSSGSVQARLYSDEAGTATVTAFNSSYPSITDSVKVAIFAPEEEAYRLELQVSNSVVSPSTATLTNTVTVTATVTNDTDEAVGNAPIAFALSETTGGGEYISPAIVYTESDGTAVTTFYAGSKSSGGDGVKVNAYLLSNDSINDEISIVIGGTAGSVILTPASTISSAYDDTMYQYKVSVVVADTNGNAVDNAVVSLKLWPTDFVITEVTETIDNTANTTTYSYNNTWYENEDANKNAYLDAGEDFYNDGQITPQNSTAGTINESVTTDEYGVATFTWNYGKRYGRWLAVDLSATTYVLGSETTSVLNVTLPILDGDEDDLPAYSPWYSWTTVEIN